MSEITVNPRFTETSWKLNREIYTRMDPITKDKINTSIVLFSNLLLTYGTMLSQYSKSNNPRKNEIYSNQIVEKFWKQ